MEQHLFDDCIGNPPFEEALKILGDVGGAVNSQKDRLNSLT